MLAQKQQPTQWRSPSSLMATEFGKISDHSTQLKVNANSFWGYNNWNRKSVWMFHVPFNCNYVSIQTPLLRIHKKTSRRRTCYHHHNNKTKCLNAIAQVEYLIRKELLTEECHTCRHQILCFSFSNDFNWMATGMSYRPPIILIRHRHWTEAATATGNNIIPESMVN